MLVVKVNRVVPDPSAILTEGSTHSADTFGLLGHEGSQHSGQVVAPTSGPSSSSSDDEDELESKVSVVPATIPTQVPPTTAEATTAIMTILVRPSFATPPPDATTPETAV